jgi:phosphohistidine phosphatase
MDLILWRHADAHAGIPDLERRLTAKGEAQAKRVGAWLDRHLPEDAQVLVSPATRAQQTAKTLRRRARTVDEIGPGASARTVLAAAGWPDAEQPVVVVGHQPTLGEVAALLVSGKRDSWTVRKAGVWWISHRVRDGAASIIVKAVIDSELT